MADDDASVRIRLEGRLELLEAARPRYRLLQLKVLGRLRWKQAVRQNAALVRELAAAETEVEAALAAVERRAAAEDWEPRSEAVRCAAEVRRLRTELATRAQQLLARQPLEGGAKPGPHSFAAALVELERLAVTAPRLVLPGQRMATATEVLRPSLPAVEELARFGLLLERVFKRPDGLGTALPFAPGELEAVEAAFARGVAAGDDAWGRIRAVDQAGTLTRYLERLARRMPLHPPRNGAEQLLFAEFWKSWGLSRLEKLVASRVSPLEVKPDELFSVARWLWALERDGQARLESPSVPRPRAALFELARALTAVAPGQDFGGHGWDRLEALAAAAGAVPLDADGEALADNLRLLLRVLAKEKPQRRAAQGEDSLLSLVGALRALAARPQ